MGVAACVDERVLAAWASARVCGGVVCGRVWMCVCVCVCVCFFELRILNFFEFLDFCFGFFLKITPLRQRDPKQCFLSTSVGRSLIDDDEDDNPGGKIRATDFGTRKSKHRRAKSGGKIWATDLELGNPNTHLNNIENPQTQALFWELKVF